ncbi:hypothetical protein PRZ48_009844 [Zasmidium cellare]|uniref:Uncharacterized protein n=1 Tax=Zasmidium cellare TaxID=395010 RepID=A0ABR0EDI2_ZASCE|nr:hypothetical protein PRZ48_009844 [Zasmidium cellare]
MPPATHLRDTPEYKIQLLRYILAIKDEYRDRDPDYVSFFNYAGKTFHYDGVSPLAGSDELSQFLDQEVYTWTKEVDGVKKRRPGHEQGSEYDQLMTAFSKALDAIIVDHWHWVVTQPGPNDRKFAEVPEDYRPKVRRLVSSVGKRQVKPGRAEEFAAHAAKMSQMSRTERHDFEYNAVKLERVVNAAMTRAREVGKADLADAVHELYKDSLENMDLRILLEKTLTQRCNETETREFQDYVRKAKRKLKQERATKTGTSSSLQSPAGVQRTNGAHSSTPKSADVKASQSKPQQPVKPVTTNAAPPTSINGAVNGKKNNNSPAPKVVVSKTEEESQKGVAKGVPNAPSCSKNGRLDSHHATEDSGYGSAKDATPSENGSNKRKTASVTSSEAAEQEDLEEARRASKRRRRAGSDDSGSYHPSMDGNRRKKSTQRKSANDDHERNSRSRSSSPLSEPDDMDIEEAKEAYVDEMVRRKSADAARKAIEEKYGPVSPSIIGDARSEPAESWASMPSPTMEPARSAVAAATTAARNITDQAVAGAQDSEARSERPHEIPGPPPEGFTPDEGAQAYKLITATVAEAIIPYFKHVDTKLDKLESQQKSIAKTASEQALPSSKELMDAAKALQTGALQANNNESTKLISQLLKNAADASIHAAEAARKAGEVARNVSEVLMHMSSNKEGAASGASQKRKR